MSETGQVIPLPTNVAPPAPSLPSQPMQIMLPPPLQEIMQKFPDLLTRVAALEAKPAPARTANTKLVALTCFLLGTMVLSLLVFLWHYGAVLLKLWS